MAVNFIGWLSNFKAFNTTSKAVDDFNLWVTESNKVQNPLNQEDVLQRTATAFAEKTVGEVIVTDNNLAYQKTTKGAWRKTEVSQVKENSGSITDIDNFEHIREEGFLEVAVDAQGIPNLYAFIPQTSGVICEYAKIEFFINTALKKFGKQTLFYSVYGGHNATNGYGKITPPYIEVYRYFNISNNSIETSIETQRSLDSTSQHFSRWVYPQQYVISEHSNSVLNANGYGFTSTIGYATDDTPGGVRLEVSGPPEERSLNIVTNHTSENEVDERRS